MAKTCDVLIIGGGAAGCVLAARLSEDAGTRVVLVEAGRDTPPGAVPDDIRDTFPVSYFNPDYFWPGLTAAANVGTPQAPYSQARVMGGGSSVMGMWALRGMPGDYDAWRDAGAVGWGWEDVLPAFRRLERDLDFDGPLHGKDGPIPVRRHPRAAWPRFVTALVEACERRQLPARDDANADFADGTFPVPFANTEEGRVSSAIGYLTDAVRRRPNLDILSGAIATRLLLEGRRAVGAEIRRGGRLETIRAAEVIVSAGGIHSPALLMRSGIGPAEELKRLGIAPRVDCAGVGRGLQNHCVVNLATWLAPEARQSSAVRTYGVACARVSSLVEGAVPGDLHLQFMAKLGAYAHGDRLGMVGAALYAPVSRGVVALRSPDPDVPPVVDFRFLSDPLDRIRMRKAVALGLDLLLDPAVSPTHGDIFLVVPSSLARRLNRPSPRNRLLSAVIAAMLDGPDPVRRYALSRVGQKIDLEAMASEELDALLDHVMPVFHPTGTCAMGATDDPAAVTDADCRVRGVGGLRVIDASIMPVIPRANTCIPTMMVAEHAAARIKAERAGRIERAA
ncbi:MAG: GMC family oxidoreductase N-terminal domain-containing protein [Variibacter sp.]|nr:GMC family oxidoreductase N-terminal domain-containing protein [Variibacter sp.]